jgi:hypothetical protein
VCSFSLREDARGLERQGIASGWLSGGHWNLVQG